jgi:aminoglycoside phosphotransferase (APT) family kinase protein
MSKDAAADLYAGTGGNDGNGDAAVLSEINARTGSGLQRIGSAEHGGSGGAVYVRWPGGQDGVVTRTPTSAVRMRQTAEVLATVRARGIPVPRHDLVVELSDGTVALVQERLPGSPPRLVDASVIDAMVAMNERFAGLLVERGDVPTPALYLRESGPLFPRHDVLEGHGDRSRRLLHRIQEIGRGEPHEMTGDDLVHPDYTLGNVLYDDDGQVSGVVDWNWGVGRGDRQFALVRIYTDLFWSTLGQNGGEYGVQRSAFDRLDEVVDTMIEPDLLRIYWAHMTLNQLHWAILYHQPAVIELFQRFGERRLF